MSWPSILQALEARFAPSQYDDPTVKLFNPSDYLSKFESLANRIIDLPTPFLLSYFISRLTPEIRRKVQALQPLMLVQAVALVRLHEEKLADSRKLFQHRPPTPGPLGSLPQHSVPPVASSALLSTPPKSPSIPFKRLS